jgi:iron complex outermembrane receptor protein
MLLATSLLHAGFASAQRNDARSYAIPSQSLGAALNQVALASDQQIMVPPELVRGRTAPALNGSYTVEAALRYLLAGSGLTYEATSAGTMVIKRLPGATPAPPPKKSNRSGAVEADAPVNLAEIEVTGSRLPRASVEGPQQVKTYSRADIARSGEKTVMGFLNTLPAVSTVVGEQGFDTVGGAGTVRLRGLPIGSTLVLLDGRAVEGAGSGQSHGNPFDLNSIPVGAVERVEIVPEAASAVYGSDAIGGVVNIILRKDMDGGEVSVTTGAPTVGDYRDTTVNLAWGKKFDKGDISLVGSYQTRGALLSTDRELTENQDFRRFGGLDERSTSCVPGTVYSSDGGNLPGLGASFAGIPASDDGLLAPSDFTGTSGVLNRCSGGIYGATVIPSTHRASVLLNGNYDIGSTTQAFVQVMYSQIKQDQYTSPRGASQALVPADNPFNPFDVPVAVTYRFASEGRFGASIGKAYFSRVLVGLKGALGERWSWEVAAWQSGDHAHQTDLNTVDNGALLAALSNPDPAQSINLFSSGKPASQEVMDRILYDAPVAAMSKLQTVNGFIRGTLFDLPAGHVDVVLGAEYNRMRQSLYAPGQGLPVVDEFSRNSRALYGEARIPILASADGLSAEKLALTMAARYDRYSDFGGQFTPQAGLEFRPTPTLLLRASYGEAYKAPDLRAVYSSAFAYEGQEVAPDPLRGGELYPTSLRYGGNAGLQPQTGTSRSIGMLWSSKAIPNLQVGLTNFRVTQDNRIIQPSPLVMMGNPDAFPGRIQRADPTADDIANGYAGRITLIDASYLNFGSLIVEGFDLDVDYRFDTAIGNFRPSLSATEIYKYEAAVAPGAPLENRLGYASGDAFATRWKGTLALDYNRGAWSARIAGRYIGNYVDYDFVRRLGNYWLYDASAHYDFGQAIGGNNPFMKSAYAELGIVNIFNKDPQFTDYYGTGYDPRIADIRGRFVSLTLGARW